MRGSMCVCVYKCVYECVHPIQPPKAMKGKERPADSLPSLGPGQLGTSELAQKRKLFTDIHQWEEMALPLLLGDHGQESRLPTQGGHH